MRNRSGVLIFVGLSVVAVLGCLFAGYYYKGSSSQTSAPPVAQNLQTAAPVVAPAPAPQKRQVTAVTDYTAPGAPDIEIAEVKGAPIPRKTEMDDADQASTNPPPPTTGDTTQPASTDDNSATQPADSGATNSGTDTTNPGDNGDNSTDNINGNGQPDQSGDNTAATPAPAPGPLYRVQAGSFINEANAKILASALRRRGYTAVAVPGTEDGKPVFKVQVGAYRNKAMADQAATDLQKSGYPAYVSH